MTSPPREETSLDRQITRLNRLRAAPPAGTDLAQVTGLLGGTLLERYWRDGDPGTLATAIDRLHEAVDRHSGHRDRAQWYGWLGLGYGERAEMTGEVADYDLAIGWMSRARAGLSGADPEDDAVTAVALAELSWDRFCARCRQPDCDDPTVHTEANRLTVQLAALSVGDYDPRTRHYLAMLRGLGHLERFAVSDEPTDLEQAVAALGHALAGLPPDTPRRGLAGAELANAYRIRALLVRDPDGLDLALATGRAVIAGSGPDQPEWELAHRYQALGHEDRWHTGREPADLDRAIACWRVVLAADPDQEAAATCGQLLRERAGRTGSRADAAEAARLLRTAGAGPPPAGR